MDTSRSKGMLLVLALFGAASCSPQPSAPAPPGLPTNSPPSTSPGAPPPVFGAQDYRQFLPNPSLTPGATFDVTPSDICVSGYSSKVRDVPEAVKKQAYAAYGIASHRPKEYEVDHLISLELGGSNDIKNLWPESYETQPWNAHVKDKLGNHLHKLICDGKIDIHEAQREIATDWIAAYKKYFPNDIPSGGGGGVSGAGTPHSMPSGAHSMPHNGTNGGSFGDPNSQVWVNLNSGVYWRPGTQYYGKTREGKYMTEQEALKAGYHTAKGQ